MSKIIEKIEVPIYYCDWCGKRIGQRRNKKLDVLFYIYPDKSEPKGSTKHFDSQNCQDRSIAFHTDLSGSIPIVIQQHITIERHEPNGDRGAFSDHHHRQTHSLSYYSSADYRRNCR